MILNSGHRFLLFLTPKLPIPIPSFAHQTPQEVVGYLQGGIRDVLGFLKMEIFPLFNGK